MVQALVTSFFLDHFRQHGGSGGLDFDYRSIMDLAPDVAVRSEIDRFLAEDDTLLGSVYTWDAEGKSPLEMKTLAGSESQGFVYTYRKQIAALRDGVLPSSPTIAGQTASRVRAWLKRNTWTTASRDYLEQLQLQLQLVADDVASNDRETAEANARTAQVEREGLPGIYVYALPHYLKYPYDADSGHTLLKVGHSAVDVFTRVGGQGRTTALPEDPVLLRVYPTGDRVSRDEEQYFHDWLEAADHSRTRSSRGGREWFLTSTKFLDRIAAQRGLEIRVVGPLDVDD